MNTLHYKSIFNAKQLFASLIVVASLTFADTSIAQSVPELDSASNLSKTSTTARFFAGTRVGSGAFKISFQLSDIIQLEVQVSPEASHIGSAGKIYVLAVVGEVAFTLLEENQWVVFDGTIAGLGGALIQTSLESSNEVSVSNLADLFNRPGVIVDNGTVSYSVYVAYESSTEAGEVFYTSTPPAILCHQYRSAAGTNTT